MGRGMGWAACALAAGVFAAGEQRSEADGCQGLSGISVGIGAPCRMQTRFLCRLVARRYGRDWLIGQSREVGG